LSETIRIKAASIPGVVYGRTVPPILNCRADQNVLPTPTEGLKMKSVFPLDVHRLREFCTAKNEGAGNLQTQRAEAEDTYSNEIGLTPQKPPMTVVACKFRGKLESL
jgi:ribosomal protein L25 (general stress protein Ctc)